MAYPALSSQNPTDRASFKAYCLRRLGAPVIEVNVEDWQVEDRIDDALQFWFDYHYDGTFLSYYKYQVQQSDITNGYITLPNNIIGAVDLFELGTAYGSGDLFNIRYQIALNDMYTLTSVSMVPYYMARQQLSLLEEILVGKQAIRFNRYDNKLYIDMDWSLAPVGTWIIVKAYAVVDPNQFTDAWSDRFLKAYATQLIKRQLGTNLGKFGKMQMPGGMSFNGLEIFAQADEEIKRMEKELLNMTLPAMDMIGVLALGIMSWPIIQSLLNISGLS